MSIPGGSEFLDLEGHGPPAQAVAAAFGSKRRPTTLGGVDPPGVSPGVARNHVPNHVPNSANLTRT